MLKIIFFILLLLFVGCEENECICRENVPLQEKTMNCPYDSDVVYKNIKRDAKDYYLLRYFLDLFFDIPNVGISLNEDLNIFIWGREHYFVYSNENVWSTSCGASEKLSLKNMREIKRLEEKMIKERLEKPFKGEGYYSLLVWKGAGQKGTLKEYSGSIYERYKADIELYDYFVKNIFIHGCKNHPFVSIPALKALPSTISTP